MAALSLDEAEAAQQKRERHPDLRRKLVARWFGIANTLEEIFRGLEWIHARLSLVPRNDAVLDDLSRIRALARHLESSASRKEAPTEPDFSFRLWTIGFPEKESPISKDDWAPPGTSLFHLSVDPEFVLTGAGLLIWLKGLLRFVQDVRGAVERALDAQFTLKAALARRAVVERKRGVSDRKEAGERLKQAEGAAFSMMSLVRLHIPDHTFMLLGESELSRDKVREPFRGAMNNLITYGLLYEEIFNDARSKCRNAVAVVQQIFERFNKWKEAVEADQPMVFLDWVVGRTRIKSKLFEASEYDWSENDDQHLLARLVLSDDPWLKIDHDSSFLDLGESTQRILTKTIPHLIRQYSAIQDACRRSDLNRLRAVISGPESEKNKALARRYTRVFKRIAETEFVDLPEKIHERWIRQRSPLGEAAILRELAEEEEIFGLNFSRALLVANWIQDMEKLGEDHHYPREHSKLAGFPRLMHRFFSEHVRFPRIIEAYLRRSGTLAFLARPFEKAHKRERQKLDLESPELAEKWIETHLREYDEEQLKIELDPFEYRMVPAGPLAAKVIGLPDYPPRATLADDIDYARGRWKLDDYREPSSAAAASSSPVRNRASPPR